MNAGLWSLPGLACVFATAVFGLNELRFHGLPDARHRVGWIQIALGLSFFGAALAMFLMIVGVIAGAISGVQVMSWRGALAWSSVAGIFVFVGRFAPWKTWIHQLTPTAKHDLSKSALPWALTALLIAIALLCARHAHNAIAAAP